MMIQKEGDKSGKVALEMKASDDLLPGQTEKETGDTHLLVIKFIKRRRIANAIPCRGAYQWTQK